MLSLIDVELIDVGNVVENKPGIFTHNPLMKVPTLLDDERVVYESDLIAQYIVKKSWIQTIIST